MKQISKLSNWRKRLREKKTQFEQKINLFKKKKTTFKKLKIESGKVTKKWPLQKKEMGSN